jgi:phage terminase large subunit-like protein
VADEPLGGIAHPDMNTRYSPALSRDFPSLFARYARPLRIAWQAATGHALDGWQEDLLCRVTETYPTGHPRAGQLRWRTALVCLPRQQGKTELAAALGLMTMIARPGGYVVGIAATALQARLVYRRAMGVIGRNRALSTRMDALTETRGIRAKDGAVYELKASKSGALQGLAVDLAIVDEVHLVKRELWTDLLNGTGSRPDTLVCGISTAGDDNSELLRGLYRQIEAGEDDRFGYFVYEAPEARVPSEDDELRRYLRMSNPALACGRVDEDNVLADARSMPPADLTRYRLNRFVSATSAFISGEAWQACARGDGEVFPAGLSPVFAVDRTPDWGHACITAAAVDEVGMLHAEVVASLAQPDLDRLEAACTALAAHQPATFAVDGYALKELGSRLKRRGLPVQVLSQGDIVSASSLFYAKISQRKLSHASDPLLTAQIPRTSRRNTGTGFRITRADSASQIDAVMSTVMSVYVAETATAAAPQLFT